MSAILSISPEAFLVCLGLALLMFEAFFTNKENKAPVGYAAIIGLVIALVLTVGQYAKGICLPEGPTGLSPNLVTFFKGFAIVATIFTIVMALDYRKVLSRFTDSPDNEDGTGEFYCLPIFASAGMLWMAGSTDIITAFVALELVTMSFYVMVAYLRRNVGSLEAGVKYLILGALSTGFLVFGIAWVYGATGTTDLTVMPQAINAAVLAGKGPILFFGAALMAVGVGFKIGAVPMQLWIPDVYQGAPTPVTAFLSVGSKAAGFALAILFIGPFLAAEATRENTAAFLAVIAGATLLVGNLAALAQNNFKRLLGYSSIAHAGFLIVPLTAWTPSAAVNTSLDGSQVVAFYLATYLIMTFGAFFILSVVRQSENSDAISAFNGLGKRNPQLALALSVSVAALAGIPLTSGFFGKFFVFENAIAAGQMPLVIIGFIAVACGFFYYFKLFRAMYWNAPASDQPIAVPALTKYAVAGLTVATVILGFYPAPILWLLGA